MIATRTRLLAAAFYLTFAAAVSILFSIAVCHTLMALALTALLLSGERFRFPPVKLPLLAYFAGTVISLMLSSDPSAGRPQLRKFFVFLMLLLIASTFRGGRDVHRLLIVWFGVAAVSSTVAIVQFLQKWREANNIGVDFYGHYIGARITGLMSHWMTFGGEMMIVLLLLAAFILFSPVSRRRLPVWLLCAALLSAAVVLGMTRGVWLATAVGTCYLLWRWRPRWLLLIPLLAAAVLWLAPSSVQTRFLSMFQPRGDLDSNQHRVVVWRTGWEMIRANPWFGIGPEHVALEFDDYIPDDIPRPLPLGFYGHLHNIYLQTAAERGIPTLLALLWLFGKMLFDFARALRRRAGPDSRYMLNGATAVILATFAAGFFELNLGDSEILTMLLTVVACGYAAMEDSKQLQAAASGDTPAELTTPE